MRDKLILIIILTLISWRLVILTFKGILSLIYIIGG